MWWNKWLSKWIIDSIQSSELRSFLWDEKLWVNKKLVWSLAEWNLKEFLSNISDLKKQGEITRDKVDKLIFDYFSKEEIDSFEDNIEQMYLKVNDICLLVDKVFKDIFDNYKLKDYDILESLLNEISEISYLLLSSPIYTNPYFKDIYGLKEIDKIEIIVHRLTRVIYDLYNISESIDSDRNSKRVEKTADKLWEVLEVIEQFIK